MSVYETLLNPKTVDIETPNGMKQYVLSKFPATVGREICTQYLMTAMPKVGDYQRNEAMMFKLMCYVGVLGIAPEGDVLMLRNEGLVNNHVEDFEVLLRIEMAMMEHNYSFFSAGKMSKYFEIVLQKARALITSIATDFLQQSKTNDSQL